MERHNSVPQRYLKASTEHKQRTMEKSKKVPTATESIVYTIDMAEQDRLGIRTLTEGLRLKTH